MLETKRHHKCLGKKHKAGEGELMHGVPSLAMGWWGDEVIGMYIFYLYKIQTNTF